MASKMPQWRHSHPYTYKFKIIMFIASFIKLVSPPILLDHNSHQPHADWGWREIQVNVLQNTGFSKATLLHYGLPGSSFLACVWHARQFFQFSDVPISPKTLATPRVRGMAMHGSYFPLPPVCSIQGYSWPRFLPRCPFRAKGVDQSKPQGMDG